MLNPSFDGRGESIVRTPQEANHCFIRTKMDALERSSQGWKTLGHGLEWIDIILGSVFVLVLQPITAVIRLSGHDPLRRQSQPDL